MTKMYYTIFVFFCFKVVFANVSWNIFSTNISNIIEEEEENLFSDINEHLQGVINNVFTYLNLDRHFIGQYETRLLLSMHASLKKISENQYFLYKDVINASRIDLKFNEFKNTNLFKLDKPIYEIMANDLSVKINSIRNVKDIKLNTNSIEIPDNSEETYVFLRDYLNNVEHIELQDIAKPSQKIREMFEKHKKFKEARRKNFKVWQPQNSNDSTEWNFRRVFKGNQVKIKKFPFVASIHVKKKFVCTGAILSRNMIISAASCFHDIHFNTQFLQIHPHAIFVRVGSEYPDSFGETIEATNVFIHPNYEAATMRDNIAIVKIKKHMHLKKKNRKIRRIEFQKMKGELPNSVHEVLILGWGDKNDQSNHLSYSHLKLYKLKDCKNIYSKYITESNFCAGFSGKGAGACQEDAGGPAIVSNVLVGVVSFGPPVCGSSYAPTVFSNIGHYVSWIESVVEQKKSRPVSTTPELSNYLNKPFVTELNLRQYSKPPQQIPQQYLYTMGNTGLQYPEPLNLLSNVLKDIMLQGERIYNENRFGIHQHVGLWNTSALTSSTTAYGSVSPPNRIDRILPYHFNEFAHKTQITPSSHHGPFQKITMKPLFFYTKYNNFSIMNKPEKILRYVTKTRNVKPNEVEESISDSENYESSEEVGMEIEVPSTKSFMTSRIEGRMALYEQQTESMPFLKFDPNFEIPPAKKYKENPEELIKRFVKNKLAPMGSQFGLSENNFGAEAETFLIQNYIKEHLYPINQQNALLKTVLPLKEAREEEYTDFIGKKYQKILKTQKEHVSDEFVLLLLKHSTLRKRRYRYQVADNTKYTIMKSYMRGLSSSFRTPKGKRLSSLGSESELKFIIEENLKPTRAYEQLPIKLSKIHTLSDGEKALQKKLFTVKERKKLVKQRHKRTKELARFTLVPARNMKYYAKYTHRFRTRLFRDVAKKRAVSNGLLPHQSLEQNIGRTDINNYEKLLTLNEVKSRSDITKYPYSNNTANTINEKEKYSLSSPTVESISDDYKSSSSIENESTDTISSEDNYNDSTSIESNYNDAYQTNIPFSVTLDKKHTDQVKNNNNSFIPDPYSNATEKNSKLVKTKQKQYQDQTIFNSSNSSSNSAVKADYVNTNDDTTTYEYETMTTLKENDQNYLNDTKNISTTVVPFVIKDDIKHPKEQRLNEDNLYTSQTELTVTKFEYDYHPTNLRANIPYESGIASNSTYYLSSSEEDALYYADDYDQQINGSDGRRSFVDYIDLT